MLTKNIYQKCFEGQVLWKMFYLSNLKGIINKPKNSVMLKKNKQSSIVIMDKWY